MANNLIKKMKAMATYETYIRQVQQRKENVKDLMMTKIVKAMTGT